MALPQGHMFYIGLYWEKPAKIFLSETTWPMALIFCMKHYQVDLYQVCSNYTTGAKNRSPGSHMLYIGLYRMKPEKNFLSETIRPRALTFGT